MHSHLRFGKLVWSLLFTSLVAAINIPFGLLGSALWLAEEQLPGATHGFILAWGALNLALLGLLLTRRRWEPVVVGWLRGARLRIGLVGDDEEVEFLAAKAGHGALSPRLLARQALAMERRYKDNPEVPRLYAEAIAGLADNDLALATSLFSTYFRRYQRVFDGSVQLRLARALRATDPDLAARSLELWLEGHKEPTPLRCDILMTTAQILARDLGMNEAAARHYRLLTVEYAGSPAAENASLRLANLTASKQG